MKIGYISENTLKIAIWTQKETAFVKYKIAGAIIFPYLIEFAKYKTAGAIVLQYNIAFAKYKISARWAPCLST